MYEDERIIALKERVRNTLSAKRYKHTIGVLEAAQVLGGYCLPEKNYELSCAALLHDISKEISASEQMLILNKMSNRITESDLICEPIHHSLTAPEIIKRDYPEYASEDVLSAVLNHTSGKADMSIFDQIIFLADYIEEGRVYPDCIEERRKLYSELSSAKDIAECRFLLFKSVCRVLDKTIISIIKRGGFLHERTVAARNSFIAKLPMPLK